MSAQPLVNEGIPIDIPEVGSVFADAYRIEAVLGTGGMGVILRATELASERCVAIKLMTPAAAAVPEQVARFRREAKAASSLTSKHVVRVLDSGELDSGLPFIVMEHLEGSSLVDVVKKRGPLPIAEAVDYVLQAIHGVAEAHVLGVVHRDLKPANLFLCGDDSAPIIKVLDFGASKLMAESQVDPSDPGGVTIASSLIGSPRYMAPEQIRTALEVDARADVYALGATLHELLSGQPIFFADSLARIFAQVLWDPPQALSTTRDDVPPALADVVMKCLAKTPEDRYATVEALASALAPFGPAASPAPSRAADAARAPAPPPLPLRKNKPPPKPSRASGSKLIASRLFKPEEVTIVDAPPAVGRVSSAACVEVVIKATARMPRVKMASEPPKRTMKLAAFALAARFNPGVSDAASHASHASSAGIAGPMGPRLQGGTARMPRFEAPLAARTKRQQLTQRLVAAGVLVGVLAVIALLTILARR
jgi:eukaryotic-like serine/threonine-protein kinase